MKFNIHVLKNETCTQLIKPSLISEKILHSSVYVHGIAVECIDFIALSLRFLDINLKEKRVLNLKPGEA
jgi:hypothetical protein